MPEVIPAVLVMFPSSTYRAPFTQCVSGYWFWRASTRDQWLVAVRPASSPAAAISRAPAQTESMRAPRRDCSATQARRGASAGPAGSSTAGTTTMSGFSARPAATSANVCSGTMAGPPSTGAGAAPAATV